MTPISSLPALTIRDLLRGDLLLASPPSVYFALKEIIDNPNMTPKDAAFIIEEDTALAANLLKIINSPYFGFPSPTVSIAKAVTLVGARELQNLALASDIIGRFSDLPGQTISMYDFWSENLRCALLSREFDIQLGGKYADSAFLCGLIHNIGRLLFYRRIPVLAREVDLLLQSQMQTDIVDEILVEQRVIGFDHFQAGAELCKQWKLPEVISETIRLQAFPDYIGPYADIAALVRLANLLAKIDHAYDDTIANNTGLSAAQVSVIINKTNDEFEAIFKLFYPSR